MTLKRQLLRRRTPLKLIALLVVMLATALTSVGWIDPRADSINKANSLLKEGSYEDALKLYENVLVKYPDDITGRLNSAIALYAIGRYEDSSSRFSEVLAVLSTSGAKLSSEADRLAKTISHYGIGCAQFKLGSALESVSEASISSQGTLNAAIEHYRRALNSFGNALKLDPEDEDARHNYRVTYERLKRLEQLLDPDASSRQDGEDDQQSEAGGQDSQDDGAGQDSQSDRADQNSTDNQAEQSRQESPSNTRSHEGEDEKPEQAEAEQTGQQLQAAQDTGSQGNMTVEEALQLLEMMDSSDQYGVLVQHQFGESSGEYPDW